MKDSIYLNTEKSLKSFDNEQEAIKYYEYMLKNNPESSVYPSSLREFHKGIIMGLKASIEIKEIKHLTVAEKLFHFKDKKVSCERMVKIQ